MTRRIRLAVVAMGCVVLGSSAGADPGPRPVAPPLTPVVQLERSVRKQQEQLGAATGVLQKYTAALKEKTAALDVQARRLTAARDEAARAERSWNTRVNPTCQHRLTFAECGCRPGTAGKAAKQAEIDRAKEQARAEERATNRAKDELGRVLQGMKGLLTEMKSMGEKLTADKQRLAAERRKATEPAPKPRPSDELPLKKPTKPGTTPDVIPLGGKP